MSLENNHLLTLLTLLTHLLTYLLTLLTYLFTVIFNPRNFKKNINNVPVLL